MHTAPVPALSAADDDGPVSFYDQTPLWQMGISWLVGFAIGWGAVLPFFTLLIFGALSVITGTAQAGARWWELLWGGGVALALGLSVGGYGAGRITWHMALQDRVDPRAWAWAGAAAAVFGIGGWLLVSGWLPDAYRVETYDSGTHTYYHLKDGAEFTLLVSTLVLGLGCGLPHWWVLRRYARRGWLAPVLLTLNFGVLHWGFLVVVQQMDNDWLANPLGWLPGLVLFPFSTAAALLLAGWEPPPA